jgi:hypothetical protein
MKKLILTICLTALSLAAKAEPIGYIPNDAGGQIVFTTEVCRYLGESFPELKRVFTFMRNGRTVEGCYYYESRTELLMVRWSDNGERSVFPLKNVTPF